MMPSYILNTELIYAFIIILLCILIYFSTKEIYELTKHKGIMYFRNTFLFFALAYFFRLLFHLFKLSGLSFNFYMPGRTIWIISLVLLSYAGTIAISSLILSTIWKKIKFKNFNIIINLIALIIALFTWITGSIEVVLYSHLVLMIVSISLAYLNHKKNKKFNQLFIIYILLFFFWITNLYVLGQKRFLPYEIKITSYIISVLIFGLIFYKVKRWIKWIKNNKEASSLSFLIFR